MIRILLSVCLALVAASSVVSAESVELKQQTHSIKATIDGEVFAVLQFSPEHKRPFILPVTGPGGFELLKEAKDSGEPGAADRKIMVVDEQAKVFDQAEGTESSTPVFGQLYTASQVLKNRVYVDELQGWLRKSDVVPIVSTVTRLINKNPPAIKDRRDPLYYDHPHHHGIWLAVDEVEGIKFWNADGLIQNVSTKVLNESGSPAVVQMVNHWMKDKDQPLLEETTIVSFYPNRLITYDTTFRAVAEKVKIGDTKEGMFAIRLPNSMREMIAGGPVVNHEGTKGSKDSWGREWKWIDYCGPIDGHVFGVTMMDDPENPWKSRYHVRDYGLFAINPFGAGSYSKGRDDEQPMHELVLTPESEPLNFRYGLFVHEGEQPAEVIQNVYQQFIDAE